LAIITTISVERPRELAICNGYLPTLSAKKGVSGNDCKILSTISTGGSLHNAICSILAPNIAGFSSRYRPASTNVGIAIVRLKLDQYPPSRRATTNVCQVFLS